MMAVIFELEPREGSTARYFELAAMLRPSLDATDGFISVERFESLTEPGKLLSLSFWRDEHAIAAWRALATHRAAQSQGRAGVFRDYRLRVAEVSRDYGLTARDQAPADSRAAHAHPAVNVESLKYSI